MDREQSPDANQGRSADSISARVEEQSAGIPLRERYGAVLLLIFLAYILGGFDESPLVLAAGAILWGALLLTTLWSPSLPVSLRRIGLIATAVVFLSIFTIGISDPTVGGVRSLIFGVAELAALLAILNRILRHERVTTQTVMGGVAAYALIAFVMAAVYRGVDLLTGVPLLNGADSQGDFTYFSFVTMTTVGYGDVTPATNLAQRLAVVEAFVGQVFIITFVARLVSLWGKPLRG